MSEDSGNGQIIAEDGSFTENWMESLPEDLREDPTLKSIQDFPAMAKMLVSSQKLIGKDKIVIPGSESTDEDWLGVFDKLGRPEKSEGYELAKPEGLPEDLPWSDETVEAFKSVAHKTGLLPKQAKDLFDWYNGAVVESYTAAEKEREDAYNGAVAALKKEWGAAYDQKLELAHTAVRAFTDEDDVKALDESLGNDPRMIKLFAKIGGAISEDKLKGTQQIATPTEVQGEINKILGDPKHPYHIKGHPEHAAAVQGMQELYRQMYPEEK